MRLLILFALSVCLMEHQHEHAQSHEVLLQNGPTLRTSQEEDDHKPRDDRHPHPPSTPGYRVNMTMTA